MRGIRSATLVAIALTTAVATAQQRPQFRGAVSRVRVDVIVTDQEGRFVADVRPEQFHLFEDEREQEVLDVQLVSVLPPAVGSTADEGRLPEPLPEAVSDDPAPTIPPQNLGYRPSDFAAMVFVIDGMSLGFQANSRFARRWASTLPDVGSVDIPHAVYLVDFLGYPHELTSFTQDPDALRSTAEKIRGKPLFGGEVDPVYVSIVGGMFFGTPLDVRSQYSRAFEVLSALCDVLAERPGRKALVWISTSSLPAGKNPDRFVGGTPAWRAQRRFHRAANSAGVSVYTIDPTLVTQLVSLGPASSREGPVDKIRRNPSAFSRRLRRPEAAPNATGGRAFIYWSDLAEALRIIERETSRFYLLTYAPPPPMNDGEYHRIRVNVSRSDVEVRARAGYFDISEDQRHQLAEAGKLVLSDTGPLVEGGR